MPTSSASEPAERAERAVAAVAALALGCVRGIGPVAFRKLLAQHGTPDAALAVAAPGELRERAMERARALYARAGAAGIDLLVPTDERYPRALLALEDPPVALFALGAMALCDRPAVAIVGARRATAYGRRVAQGLAAAVARTGATVISGLAMGIDAEAHAAALGVGGGTIAVLGTGVDVAYPRSNAALHGRLARDGLLLSESPPGRTAHAGAFPRRNRLIAALADVVVVVEAGVKSGALITAQLGAGLGRLVAAVPGPIDAPSSAGTNLLLRDGAQVVTTAEDVLGLLSITPRGRTATTSVSMGASERLPSSAAGDGVYADSTADAVADASPERRVLAVLLSGPQLADDLVHAARVSPRDLAVALATLSIAGLVDVDVGGLVRRV